MIYLTLILNNLKKDNNTNLKLNKKVHLYTHIYNFFFFINKVNLLNYHFYFKFIKLVQLIGLCNTNPLYNICNYDFIFKKNVFFENLFLYLNKFCKFNYRLLNHNLFLKKDKIQKNFLNFIFLEKTRVFCTYKNIDIFDKIKSIGIFKKNKNFKNLLKRTQKKLNFFYFNLNNIFAFNKKTFLFSLFFLKKVDSMQFKFLSRTNFFNLKITFLFFLVTFSILSFSEKTFLCLNYSTKQPYSSSFYFYKKLAKLNSLLFFYNSFFLKNLKKTYNISVKGSSFFFNNHNLKNKFNKKQALINYTIFNKQNSFTTNFKMFYHNFIYNQNSKEFLLNVNKLLRFFFFSFSLNKQLNNNQWFFDFYNQPKILKNNTHFFIFIQNLKSNNFDFFFKKNILKKFSKQYKLQTKKFKFLSFFLINVFEKLSNSKIFIKLLFNVLLPNQFLNFITYLTRKYFHLQVQIGKGFFLQEMLYVIFYMFLYRDIFIFKNWLKLNLERMSFIKHKKFFYNLKVILKKIFPIVLRLNNIRGFYLDVCGKISVAGNSRKRRYIISIGLCNFSGYHYKLSYTKYNIRTKTGALGVTTALTYI